ncbi:GNAT family N-acetyltransferase [Paenibacillus sp. HJGM_3]|uniref:GNAT family N-acetyltransferase n=1 Tax=Paenibacillus sp. HJGM_3 TaxID=3379816 RepID=UPI00385D4DB9
MFHVSQLDSTTSPAYESLTFQYARPLLQQLNERPTSLALGAEWRDGARKTEAVGLLLLHCPAGSEGAEVVSLFVKAPYRRRGIGTALLRLAEGLLQERQRSKLSLIYYSGKPITPAIESFLHREGWSPPETEGKVYTADMRIAEAPWLQKTGMPSGMRSFYWQELPGEEKTRLEKLEGSLYPAYLSPFKAVLPLEKRNSLGLRARGETVGWCITYRIAEDTVLYDSVYIAPEYRLSGCAFMLIAQSISIQLEHRIPRAIFAVNREAPFMRRMLDRWLGPYTTGISERKSAHKDLCVKGGLAVGTSHG